MQAALTPIVVSFLTLAMALGPGDGRQLAPLNATEVPTEVLSPMWAQTAEVPESNVGEQHPTLSDLRRSVYEVILSLPQLDETAELAIRDRMPESTHIAPCASASAVRERAKLLLQTASFVSVETTFSYPENELHMMRRSRSVPRFIDRVILYFRIAKQTLLDCRNTFGFWARREYVSPGSTPLDPGGDALVREMRELIDSVVAWLGKSS